MKPFYNLAVDGTRISLHERLISVTVIDKRGMEADELNIVIDDFDGKVSLPRKQANITIQFGIDGGGAYEGEFIADSVSHSGAPDIITIRARSADFKDEFLEQRDQSYHQKSLNDILATISARNNLTLAIAQDLAAIQVEHIDQSNESDANFITRLAKDYGAIATVKAKHLLFINKDKNKNASGENLPVIGFLRSDTISHNYTDADREQRVTGVIAYYQDTKKAKRKKVLIGKKGYCRHIKQSYVNKSAATNAAKAEFKNIQTQGATITLDLAIGRVQAIAECGAVLSGFKQEIDNLKWTIDEVTHTLNNSGFVTSVNLVCQPKL